MQESKVGYGPCLKPQQPVLWAIKFLFWGISEFLFKWFSLQRWGQSKRSLKTSTVRGKVLEYSGMNIVCLIRAFVLIYLDLDWWIVMCRKERLDHDYPREGKSLLHSSLYNPDFSHLSEFEGIFCTNEKPLKDGSLYLGTKNIPTTK